MRSTLSLKPRNERRDNAHLGPIEVDSVSLTTTKLNKLFGVGVVVGALEEAEAEVEEAEEEEAEEEAADARASWSITQCRSRSARSKSRLVRAALACSTWRCMNFMVFNVPDSSGWEGSLAEVF